MKRDFNTYLIAIQPQAQIALGPNAIRPWAHMQFGCGPKCNSALAPSDSSLRSIVILLQAQISSRPRPKCDSARMRFGPGPGMPFGPRPGMPFGPRHTFEFPSGPNAIWPLAQIWSAQGPYAAQPQMRFCPRYKIYLVPDRNAIWFLTQIQFSP